MATGGYTLELKYRPPGKLPLRVPKISVPLLQKDFKKRANLAVPQLPGNKHRILIKFQDVFKVKWEKFPVFPFLSIIIL